MLCVYLRTNSDLWHLQHKLIGFYNRDEKCLLRGMNWVFKYSRLRFVFKGLMVSKNVRLEEGCGSSVCAELVFKVCGTFLSTFFSPLSISLMAAAVEWMEKQ